MSREQLLNKVKAILLSKGIRIDIGGCGCCSSPWVQLEVDGEVIVEDEPDFNINMISDTYEYIEYKER